MLVNSEVLVVGAMFVWIKLDAVHIRALEVFRWLAGLTRHQRVCWEFGLSCFGRPQGSDAERCF